MEKKKTMILGASTNPSRYANIAANRLSSAGHPIVNIGLKSGEVAQEPIQPYGTLVKDVDTITLYLGPQNQPQYYQYILDINPKRLVFNPGTENEELNKLAKEAGIETIEACTLVMLATGQY